MGKIVERLSARTVASMTRPGVYADGNGLYLRIAGSSKAWVFRYMQNGKSHNMGLGPTHTVSLAEARERAAAFRLIKLDGFDPIHKRRETVIANAIHAVATFGELLNRYITRKEVAWRRTAEADSWRTVFNQHARGLLASHVDTIETAHIRRALDPVFAKSFKLGRKLQYRIEKVMDFAAAEGHRKGENPARWKQHLATIFHAPEAAKATKNHEAMDYRVVPSFMSELRATRDVKTRALEFLILTASRRGEVARDERTTGMLWSEVYLDKALWTVPAGRMKKGREHKVPLSERAVAILREMGAFSTGPESSVFPVSQSAIAKYLNGVRPGITLHGFRSTFATWAQDETNFSSEVVMHCIAHIEGTASDLAYKRGDAVEKRRAVMAAWADFCAGDVSADNVALLRA